jgi:uncharacterized protein
MGDFDDTILLQRDHRPWPRPDAPWVMTQTWHDLLFAHWPIPPDVLRPRLPAEFEIDLFEGQAWVAVVPFRMSNVSPRGVPALPWLSRFPELNVRTYVRAGGRPGVYFFSLDAANPVAVHVARALAYLPYYRATMSAEEREGRIHYASRRSISKSRPTHATFVAEYGPIGPPQHATPGSLVHFLTERYCLHTLDRSRRPRYLEVHHPPWPLQPAAATISANTMAEAAGIELPQIPPLLHFVRRLDVVAWKPELTADS